MIRMLFVFALGLAWSAWADDPTAVHTEVLIKSTASWDGTPLPPYPQGSPEVTLLRIRIPPGVQLPVHRHPVINAGVLLRGELTVTSVTGQTLQLRAGDTLVELVDTWHTGRNDGSEVAEILVFYAGVAAAPITVRQDAAASDY